MIGVTRLACLALTLLALAVPGWSEGSAPPMLTREQWGSRPQTLPEELRQTPRRLVIHHAGVTWKKSDDPIQRIRALQLWGQREKGWPDLPYHYLIAPSGQIFEGRDWHYRPESNTSYDLEGVLNVELCGNFDEQRLGTAQLKALVHLLGWLCQEHHLDPAGMQGHQDAAPGQTTCPGQDVERLLRSGQLQAWTRQAIDGSPPAMPWWTPFGQPWLGLLRAPWGESGVASMEDCRAPRRS